jgi:hypothetical protein
MPTFKKSLLSPAKELKSTKTKKDFFLKENLQVDEVSSFHDPYSDLNLFLYQEVKKWIEIPFDGKKWTIKLQEQLLEEINPLFQKRFPMYRLSVSALRKIWERLSYFFEQIQDQKEALTFDGKMNVSFFIKENLKQTLQWNPSHFLSQHWTHHLALKLSEWLAAIDGKRPDFDYLFQLISSAQKHLIPSSQKREKTFLKDEYSGIDQLIVQTMLDILSQNGFISSEDLEKNVFDSIYDLELPSLISNDRLVCAISSLFSEQIYRHFFDPNLLTSKEKKNVFEFLEDQMLLCRSAFVALTTSEKVRRILSLYHLACRLPKNLSQEQIYAAVSSMYPVLKEGFDFPQSLCAFISAQCLLMKTETYCYSLDYVMNRIWQVYEQVKLLPLEIKEEWIEIIAWKLMSEKEGILENLPYRLGKKIEEQIALTRIHYPELSFSSSIHRVMEYFKKNQLLSAHKKDSTLSKRVHIWCLQGELVYSFLHLDSPLLHLIEEHFVTDSFSDLIKNVTEITTLYLNKYPFLTQHAEQLHKRIEALCTYIWYQKASDDESSWDRFIKKQSDMIVDSNSEIIKEDFYRELEKRCSSAAPLLPLIFSEKLFKRNSF